MENNKLNFVGSESNEIEDKTIVSDSQNRAYASFTLDIIKLFQEKHDEDSFKNKIDQLYVEFNSKNRIMYMEITRLLYEDINSSHQQIIENLQHLEKLAELKFQECQKFSKGSDATEFKWDKLKFHLKLIDHVNLALLQKENLEGTFQQYYKLQEIFSNKLKEIQDDLEVTEKRLNGLERKITIDIVAVLGIFTGISFLLFGGISMTTSMAELIAKPYPRKTSMIGLLIIGLVISNSIVFFMHYVKSITDQDYDGMMDLFWEEGRRPGLLLCWNFILIVILVVLIYTL